MEVFDWLNRFVNIWLVDKLFFYVVWLGNVISIWWCVKVDFSNIRCDDIYDRFLNL